MRKKFYVTTAIDYVNDKPHIGHSYQKILADVLARWHKQLGEDVFFLTGTDEHGQKLVDSAEKAKLSPKKFVDKMHKFFKLAWDSLDVNYDRFIRTTDKDHEAATKRFVKLLYDKGDIYLGKYEGLYCQDCEAYVTDKDLVDGRCPVHINKTPKLLSEECYFFKLSKYQDALLDLYEQRPRFVLPESRFNEIKKRVEAGLKDLAISRTTFSWGIPFPIGKGHVTYVWFEALLNYITGVGWDKNLKKFKKYWPANFHLLGKDNGWFHAVIWPAMLIAAEIEPPQTVYVHGFLNLEGQKISKSLGNVIYPVDLVKKYNVDAYRYFFMKELNPREDGSVSEASIVERYNAELANELGNLVSRVVSMIESYCKGKVPKGKLDKKLDLTKTYEGANKHLEDVDADRAAEEIWAAIREVNKYIQDNKPWELAKTNKSKLNDILFTCANSIKNISGLVWPFIPGSAEKIAKQIGVKVPKFKDLTKPIKAGTKVKKGDIIFPKLTYVAEKKKFNLDIRVGKLASVEEVPDSQKLYKVRVDFGDFSRQAVAGLKPYFTTSELKGKDFIFLVNLTPAKLAGISSECMILAAEDDGKIDLLTSSEKVGAKLILENYDLSPAKQVSLKDFADWKLKVKDGKVLAGDAVLISVKSKLKKGLVK